MEEYEIVELPKIHESRSVDAPYVKIYIKDMYDIGEISPASIRVLLFILNNMSNSNKLILDIKARKKISRQFNLPLSTVNRHISHLYKCRVLLKRSKKRSEYTVNAMYFSKAKSLKSALMRTNLLGIDWRISNN